MTPETQIRQYNLRKANEFKKAIEKEVAAQLAQVPMTAQREECKKFVETNRVKAASIYTRISLIRLVDRDLRDTRSVFHSSPLSESEKQTFKFWLDFAQAQTDKENLEGGNEQRRSQFTAEFSPCTDTHYTETKEKMIKTNQQADSTLALLDKVLVEIEMKAFSSRQR